MTAYTVTVESEAKSRGDELQYAYLTIVAPDAATACELAIAQVEASGEASEVTKAMAVEDETPEQNDATIAALVATLQADFPPRSVA